MVLHRWPCDYPRVCADNSVLGVCFQLEYCMKVGIHKISANLCHLLAALCEPSGCLLCERILRKIWGTHTHTCAPVTAGMNWQTTGRLVSTTSAVPPSWSHLGGHCCHVERTPLTAVTLLVGWGCIFHCCTPRLQLYIQRMNRTMHKICTSYLMTIIIIWSWVHTHTHTHAIQHAAGEPTHTVHQSPHNRPTNKYCLGT